MTPERMMAIIDKVMQKYTNKPLEELKERHSPFTEDILAKADVLVDGEYKKDLRDVQVKWRGSNNQRVIDLKKTRENNEITLWCD